MKKNEKLTKEKLEELYLSGMTMAEIGRQYGLTGEGVAYRMKKFGIKTLPPEYFISLKAKEKGLKSLMDLTKEELEELNKKYGRREIAKMYGCSEIVITERRKKFGLPALNKTDRINIKNSENMNNKCFDKNDWGFVWESKEKATGTDPETGLGRSGLDEYLAVIFPEVDDWIYNKKIDNLPNDMKILSKPDYRSEKLKMIVEFDGTYHYNSPNDIERDLKNQQNYINLGYKVVRIPFFIQLTNEVVKILFGVDVPFKLFNENIPSIGPNCKNTPAFLCPAGVVRMAIEFKKFQEQYKTNIEYLEKINDEKLTCVKLLKKVYDSIPDNCDFSQYEKIMEELYK